MGNMQEREKICTYLHDRRDAADRHLWVMNSVHFIHSQIPLMDKTVSTVTPLSSAHPCFTALIYPLLNMLPCSFHNQPLHVGSCRELWDGYQVLSLIHKRTVSSDTLKSFSTAEEPRRTCINELLH